MRKTDASKRYEEFTNESQSIFKELYKQYVWPEPPIVGRDGTDACYCLANSSSINSGFQYETAMLLKDALPKGECCSTKYAVTIDRWLCLSYQSTVYGSFNDYNEESGGV